MIDSPLKVATPSTAVAVSFPPSVRTAGVRGQRQRHLALEGRIEVAVGIQGRDLNAEGFARRDTRASDGTASCVALAEAAVTVTRFPDDGPLMPGAVALKVSRRRNQALGH